jgi:hypothetical protein
MAGKNTFAAALHGMSWTWPVKSRPALYRLR